MFDFLFFVRSVFILLTWVTFDKYLSNHDCGHVFKDVFELEDKASESIG